MATISVIMRNAFHLNCQLFAPTRELLNEAVGMVLSQTHYFLGELGFGVVNEDTGPELGYQINEVNDPQVNRKLNLNLPVGCVIHDESRFVGRLD